MIGGRRGKRRRRRRRPKGLEGPQVSARLVHLDCHSLYSFFGPIGQLFGMKIARSQGKGRRAALEQEEDGDGDHDEEDEVSS